MICENIKALCTKNGISLSELERATGIGNGVIRRWNDMSPRLDLITRVAEYFGVTVDYLQRATDSDEPVDSG